MKKNRQMVLSVLMTVAIFLGGGVTVAHASPVAGSTVVEATVLQKQPTATAAKIAAPLLRPAVAGECWAQAGRVIGGLWGSIIATAANPWMAAIAWSQYFGQLSKEQKDKYGNLAC